MLLPKVVYEQLPIESRADVLTYTTAPFSHAIDVVGNVDVTVFVSSSAADTDLIVRLADVHPDGRSYNLTESGRRLRYRDGMERPEPMQPGRIYKVGSRHAHGRALRSGTFSAAPGYEQQLPELRAQLEYRRIELR